MPMTEDPEVERVLDTRVAKHTRGKEYLELLVKWMDCSTKDSRWMSVATIQKESFSFEDLMSRSS